MSDNLQLPGLNVIEVHDDRYDYLLRVAQAFRPASRPTCGGLLIGSGTKSQGITFASVAKAASVDETTVRIVLAGRRSLPRSMLLVG